MNYRLRIAIPLFSFILAYLLLIQGAFPWLAVCILFALNAFGIYLLRPRVLLKQQAALTLQSTSPKVTFELLKAMAVGILFMMLYDYFVRHSLRWEAYSAALTVQFVMLLIGFGLAPPNGVTPWRIG